MAGRFAKLLLVLAVATACLAQTTVVTGSPASPGQPPLLPKLAPQQIPTLIYPPPAVPLPPDVLIPDLGELPKADAQPRSAAHRALDRLAPRCMDWIFHTCWAQPPALQPADIPENGREAARNIEIGDTYFSGRNYRAAESRYREALQFRPNHAEATFKLATALEKLGRVAEAHEAYERCLHIMPGTRYAVLATRALQRLNHQQPAAGVKKSPVP